MRSKRKTSRQVKPVDLGRRLETTVDQHMRTCPICGALYSDKIPNCPECQLVEKREK